MNIACSLNQICRWSSWCLRGWSGQALATKFTYLHWCALTPNLHSSLVTTEIDFLSSHLPTSPPIVPVLNVGLVSVGTEMTAACEIPLNLFAIKWMLTFINSNLTVDQIEGELLISCNILLLSWLVHACSKSLYSISDNSLYRSSKFWLAYLSPHFFCSECRSDACQSVLL